MSGRKKSEIRNEGKSTDMKSWARLLFGIWCKRWKFKEFLKFFGISHKICSGNEFMQGSVYLESNRLVHRQPDVLILLTFTQEGEIAFKIEANFEIFVFTKITFLFLTTYTCVRRRNDNMWACISVNTVGYFVSLNLMTIWGCFFDKQVFLSI